jgi:hypothetical protein
LFLYNDAFLLLRKLGFDDSENILLSQKSHLSNEMPVEECKFVPTSFRFYIFLLFYLKAILIIEGLFALCLGMLENDKQICCEQVERKQNKGG